MTDSDQYLHSIFVVPYCDSFRFAFRLLRGMFCMPTRDEGRVAKQEAKGIQIMDRMVQDLETWLARQPGPHVPGCVNAYLDLYIQNIPHPSRRQQATNRSYQ